jgi:hypothetical protein
MPIQYFYRHPRTTEDDFVEFQTAVNRCLSPSKIVLNGQNQSYQVGDTAFLLSAFYDQATIMPVAAIVGSESQIPLAFSEIQRQIGPDLTEKFLGKDVGD